MNFNTGNNLRIRKGDKNPAKKVDQEIKLLSVENILKRDDAGASDDEDRRKRKDQWKARSRLWRGACGRGTKFEGERVHGALGKCAPTSSHCLGRTD